MSENIIDRTLIVTSVTLLTEIVSGDFIYQVVFGYYTKNTPEILSRLPPEVRSTYTGNQIAINEMSLLVKADTVPYKVGSKWKLTIRKNGTMNMVEAK